jgi:hypothetical protein
MGIAPRWVSLSDGYPYYFAKGGCYFQMGINYYFKSVSFSDGYYFRMGIRLRWVLISNGYYFQMGIISKLVLPRAIIASQQLGVICKQKVIVYLILA